MKVWTNGTDTVVAPNLDAMQAIVEAHYEGTNMSDETTTEAPPETFSADDIAAILTDEDLRQRSQALHEAQELYEEYAYLSVPKVPCRECSGGGSIDAGSLGSGCPNCGGTRVVDRPGAAPPAAAPDFAALRAAITAYGNAKMNLELPEGHIAKRQDLALPAPSSVPTIPEIAAIAERSRGLTAALEAPARQQASLPAPKRARKAMPDGGNIGDLGDFDEAEIVELEREPQS